jgi:hypothetical protein
MSRKSAPATSVKTKPKTVGYGVPDTIDPHFFLVRIPPGRNDTVEIIENYGIDGGINGRPEMVLRCRLPRPAWSAIAEDLRREFNERLKTHKLTTSRWTVGDNAVERLLGKELLVLAWAIESADTETIPNAVRNWLGLKPEERWWLYTITAAATGHADNTEIGWRKALRYALTENPSSEVDPLFKPRSDTLTKPDLKKKRQRGLVRKPIMSHSYPA